MPEDPDDDWTRGARARAREVNTIAAARWVFCFVVLPGLWIAFSLLNDFDDADQIVAAAILAALLSGVIGYLSGEDDTRIISAGIYVVLTGVIMAAAFFATVVILLSRYCGDGRC